jgi:hypothetical protein
MARRVPVLAGLVLCLLVGLATPASAGPWVDRAAGSLRDDPLYVNPSARPTLSAAEVERVRARLAVAGTPVLVAVLPGQARREAGGDVNRLAGLVAASVGRPGTYLVVAGGEEGAGSNTLAKGVAATQARAAFRQHPGMAAATLDFVGRAEKAAGRRPATTPPPQPPPGEDADGNTVLVVLLAIAGVVTVAVLLALTLENRSTSRPSPTTCATSTSTSRPRRPATPRRSTSTPGRMSTWSGPSRSSSGPGTPRTWPG